MSNLTLLLLALIGWATGEIVKDPTLCGRVKCHVSADRKFKYSEKIYYQYRYRIDVSTNLGKRPGFQNESELHINADVTLRFSSPCEGSLRLDNVSVSHDRASYQSEFPDRAGSEFKDALERYPLRFAFDDGEIRELCPASGDEVWALNLRRGLLSMLQNTMLRFDVDHRHDELDINGICETHYRLHEARHTSLIVRKSKNLASCRHSTKHLSLIQSQTYRSPLSRTHAFQQPLLISNSECEITIDHNVYERIQCRDDHRLRPLSNGNNAGARTEIVSSLELVGELNDNPHTKVNEEKPEAEESFVHTKRKNLLYDHAKSPRTIYGELRTSRDLLKTMCILDMPQELRENFSEIFTKFIHSARMLDYQGLSQLYNRAQGICKTGRKHIINALPFIGSNAAVNVMKDLIIKGYVDKDKVSFWVTAFTLIPRPDQHTINALAPLLDFQSNILEAQFILSYSSVIHTYCITHGTDCTNLESIKKFMKFVEENVVKGCIPRASARSNKKETLEALKAIGNAGLETKTLLDELKTCINDESGFIDMEVKIAAIEAHRRFPSCEKSRNQFFLNNYRNFTIDTEIRIASYLQVMRCPDYNVVKIIRRTLEEEEVNQVGSFVWSHLKNMLSSSSPTRIEIQSLLTDRDLGNKFNGDLRKFSRNYENSFFSEEYNIGANYQTNLIFSPKSYIPRTVSFNLTFDLFGESVNFFEVNMRAEGLEFYAENLFGPSGPFSSVKVADHFRQFLRHFRSVNDQDSEKEYWNNIKKLPNVIDNDFNNPRISLSYKIFGNEIKFTMLNSDQDIRTTLASLSPWEKVKQILSGKEIVHYENTAMFLDSSYVVPSTTGLPVKLDVSGSAACNIKLSGILNSQKLISNGELEINGNIMPSVSIDITGTMTVDAFYKSSGIKLKSSIYSIGAVEADLKIKGLKLAKLSWKIPSHKMEVFSLTTDILLVTTNGAEYKEQPIVNFINTDTSTTIIKNTTCSWSALDRLIGLKLCADYQFPNVTKNLNTSYFLLNGPTIFKLSLIKADPTADSYLLEYKWKRTANESTIRLAFDTPGSQMQREISATVSFDALNNNVTLLLKSKGNSLIAQGTYKRTDDETFIDIGLNSNGTKHLDARIGYSRKKAKYGYTYSPKLYLAINNERIVNLSGSITNQDKNNASECHIGLRFETKNLSSHIFGYILKGNDSISGNIKIEYRFHEKFKNEVLQTEFSVINRSTKALTYKAADMKLHSTAYPQLNIVAGLRYQHALGHIELHIEVNTSPHLHNADRHKLTAQFVATYSKPYFQTDGATISAYVAITKPAQDIDIKIGVNYYSIGSESKTRFLIRYAPGKEITLTINVIMPRGTLFAIEGRANLTIPNFNSMIVSAKITERSRNEYDLDFAGTWFSGHNMSARGTYYDHSTVVVTNHNLDIYLKSPSFTKDILVNCKLYHDVTDLKIGLFIEQVDIDKYALILNHTMISSQHFSTFLEGKYRSSTYSLLSNVDLERQAILKLHFDKWRDVHIIATGIDEEINKEYGIEIKWDANRDAALKFVTNVQLNKFVSLNDGKNVSAVIHISYPGRLVTGSCLFTLRARNNYIMDTCLEWNTDRAIKLTVDTDYDAQNWIKILKLESQLLTPFKNWKKTSLNGKYLQTESDISASGSIYWQDSQHVIFEVTGNTKIHDGLAEWNANCGLMSTVHTIQFVTANLTHAHIYAKSADSHIVIKYHPDKVIDARSVWLIDNGKDDTFNVTGNLQLLSPVVNYRKGEFKCHLSSKSNWKFYGVANLDLDKRKYTSHLIGDLTRLKESMVQFNITTPFVKYAFIRGRFGLSENNRHIVAEIATPAGPLGIEGICQLFTSNYDFNIKLLLATPIDVIQKALLVAKLNQQEADFRVAYNNMTAGFEGVWFYHNISNFHYSYILYTPLQGFHEIGAITKLVVIQKEPSEFLNIDTEFSLRVVTLVAGIKAHIGPKLAPPIAIPVKSELKLSSENTILDAYDSTKDTENLNWKAEVEINAVIIEPITASLDFDREGYTDKILGILKLPQGTIIIDDSFYFEDFFNIKNDLSIDTPFKCGSEIISTFSFGANMENFNYLMDLSLNIKNNSEWINSGFYVNYTYQGLEEGDLQLHLLQFDLKTPVKFLKYMNSKSFLEIDENYYKTNISIQSVESSIDFVGSLEQDINFYDLALQMKMNTPILIISKTKINAKKDYTDKEKHIEFDIDIEEPELKSVNLNLIFYITLIKFQVNWIIEEHMMKGLMVLNTWLEPLIDLEGSILYDNSVHLDNTIITNAYFKYYGNQNYKLTGQLKDGKIKTDFYMPIYPHQLIFNGNLVKINENLYEVVGNLTDIEKSTDLQIKSSIQLENSKIISIDINTIPKVVSKLENQQHSIHFKLKKEMYGLALEGESQKVNGSVKMNLVNSLNWDFQAQLSQEHNRSYDLITFMNVQVNGNTTLYLRANTPWKKIKNLVFDSNLLLNSETGSAHAKYQLNQDSGYICFLWHLFYLSDMLVNVTFDHRKDTTNTKDIKAIIFYINPKKAFKNINVGFNVNIDKDKWRFGTNASVGLLDQNNFDALLNVQLPQNTDMHNLLLSYHANNNYNYLSYVIGYSTDVSKSNYASDGSINMDTNDINGHLRLTWGLKRDQNLNNLFNITFDSKQIDFKYALFTRKFLKEETFLLFAKYNDKQEHLTFINTDLYYPARNRIGSANISYHSLININGTINAWTPFPNFSNISCKFIVSTTLKQNKRFLQLFWQNNSALIDSDYTYNSERLNSNLDGYIRIEFPLNTCHEGLFTYGYKKRPLVTVGYSDLKYNNDKIIEGLYNEKSESRAGFEKDRIEISIENSFRPIGIVYVNQYEYSAGNEGTNYPTLEYKEVNIYQLNNISAFNVSGTSKIRTTHTGQEIQLTAVHSNRTVKFHTDFNILSGEFDQNSWFSLADDAWISYHINILNKTTNEVENQFIILSLVYPKRNFTINGSYLVTESKLNSEAKLMWESDEKALKVVGAAFDWKNVSSEQNIIKQMAVLSIKHPSFKKDVKFSGTLARRDIHDLLNIGLTVDYSTHESKLLILSAIVRDESNWPIERKYSYSITGEHLKTQLNMNINGYFKKYKTSLVETINSAHYKRSFLPEENGKLLGRINLNKNEVEFSRINNEYVKYLQARYYANYPEYIINGSMINGRELNATGVFFINLQEKLTWMMVNYTPDAIESLRMYGNVPDARNAEFDIWRTYDQDLSVSDVSFYVRLNHSRLVTSKLKWRPKLKSDVINIIKSSFTNSYDELSKDIDYWRHYIRSETISVISDIWTDAQEELEEFLTDLNDLRIIEGDFKNLKIYLNNSYNANEFYIKDIVIMGMYVIDELSLRSHIQSLPNIINEIWEIMGESGEAIRNSLLWIIETIKNAYQKLSEITNAVLRGDSMNQIASIVEKFIIKYDMFVKELHVSFIKYIEYLYNKIYQSISLQWHRFLMHIEPIFIRLAHYLETVGWKAIQEFFNFLYDRKIELITSPYYDQFSNFTQDIDKFYRDIKANDIITNIQKYSTTVIQFIKERYFAFVPFGKELKDVVDEIITELKELKKLPSVKYASEKIQQIYERALYLYEYFEVRTKLESTVRLIHSKLMDISQTALQAESRYREAKTKFIYDPNHGLMCLEQKLPMSWHAFNQTPEFQEIPEYRAIVDMGSYFTSSNTTFWTLYYQIKPLTEPSNWLPPFKAQAMIIGGQHFRTFDGRYFEFAGSCTYLAAHDFVRNHFAILIKYERNASNASPTYKIIVLVGKNGIQIDVFNDNVKLLGQNASLQLPTELENGTVFVYQDDSIVSVERKNNQLKLECNLKYDLCTLELAGWYYGKTAGLLGTMNNEQIDDFLTSNGRVEQNIGRFAQSWSLELDECTNSENLAVTRSSDIESDFCRELFTNKSSEFSACFGIVDSAAYRSMCANSVNEREACGVAMSYLQTCMFHDTYLRIPNECTACGMNGTGISQIPEGDFLKLEGETVPQSADIIFIVEAKECNRGIRQNRSIDQLIMHIDKELNDNNLIDNRWSLVIFGGNGVYDKPRSLILDNKIFTKNAIHFADYFDHIIVGDGSQDIFEAIRFAAQLVFRAGVSKTFILMPCSHCETDKQTLDYSVLYHALQERGITLHILMDGEYKFEKGRLNKIFYGLDATRSYTKKDSRVLLGDVELRRQVKLSKNALGYCTPLSLETNGAIFSGSKLRTLEKLGSIKKFASVFAKRLALTAQPSSCQLCECIADNDGITKMECAPCDYPTPITVDFVSETFNEDDLTGLQSIDVDYGQIDADED
ncbi:PREDICTED: uncharacterized protein LOC105365190 [Ceratosolen solmsi marchali]|uniref:Uncharacterized protein LOC105365190 n=1 Tax=Ceratosolen solmsi marchali TaxID=326594 RepID=A0AAJ6YP38_9HYME|nr:PREDICTED: uncharacterized protein LOC105365190 [Ceratosolen solmsi marchali]